MGVPTSGLLAPAPAAATDPMGHTTATSINTSAIGPSVRGIERPSIGSHPARAKLLAWRGLGLEGGAVEAQVLGHVGDPVLGLVRPGQHVPFDVQALIDKRRVD